MNKYLMEGHITTLEGYTTQLENKVQKLEQEIKELKEQIKKEVKILKRLKRANEKMTVDAILSNLKRVGKYKENYDNAAD